MYFWAIFWSKDEVNMRNLVITIKKSGFFVVIVAIDSNTRAHKGA
jgi:hypothetical protein